MKKKLVIDIFPPEKNNKKELFLEKKEAEIRPAVKEEPREEKEEIIFDETKKKKNYFKIGIAVFLGFLAVVFIVFHFFLAQVKVVVWPQIREVSFTEEVVLGSQVKNLDYATKAIPGKIFETEKTITEEFPASNNALKKAEGVIRLFNAYSTNGEIWREGTRFVSSEGKLFLSKEKINVPGAQLKNGKIVPSFVDIPVIAAEGGEEYNIGPSKFSVFVFRGTDKYTKFYGESSEPMKGGGKALQVTKEDIEKAEKAITEKIKLEAEEALKKEIPTDYVFIKDIMEVNVLEKKPLAQVGEIVDKFQFQIKLKAKTLCFRNDDIKNFTKSLLVDKIPPETKIYQEDFKIDYPMRGLDWQEQKAKLAVSVSAKTIFNINNDSLKRLLAGKSLKEAKDILSKQLEIAKSEIKISPFWLNKIPLNFEKIKIEQKD